MCNLYRMTRGVDEVARLFGAQSSPGLNLAEEVYPGYPGLVIAPAADGRLKARSMTWGFPLARTGRSGRPLKPKPVTNARDDKLTTGFWRNAFSTRRCLVPITAWAEAEGEPGRMTRAWYELPEGEPFAVAGLWRPTPEWGDAYAMVMCPGSQSMAEVHDRMPVILPPEAWTAWLAGSNDEALALCRTWSGALRADRTREKWAGGEEVEDPKEPATFL